MVNKNVSKVKRWYSIYRDIKCHRYTKKRYYIVFIDRNIQKRYTIKIAMLEKTYGGVTLINSIRRYLRQPYQIFIIKVKWLRRY